MKRIQRSSLSILLGTILLSGANTFAGGHSGNGGVVFDCPNRIQLVDAWEAEDLGHPMRLGEANDPMEALAKTYYERMGFFSDSLAEEFYILAIEIIHEIRDISVNPRGSKTKWVRFTEGPLNSSLDSDEINAPYGCKKEQVVTQKPPQLRGERLFTIYRPLWERMDNEMKVFTIFHEIWVKRAIRMGHTTTTRPARTLNQFIGSPGIAGSASVCE